LSTATALATVAGSGTAIAAITIARKHA